jgi:hypothetical protein
MAVRKASDAPHPCERFVADAIEPLDHDEEREDFGRDLARPNRSQTVAAAREKW